MGDGAELGRGVARVRRLERDGAGQNAAVDLRQRDMHCEIGGSEAAERGAPGLEPHARQHDLQHRRVDGIENGSSALVEPGGKGGRVEHDVEGLRAQSAPATERARPRP